jgi:hypothetical protein
LQIDLPSLPSWVTAGWKSYAAAAGIGIFLALDSSYHFLTPDQHVSATEACVGLFLIGMRHLAARQALTAQPVSIIPATPALKEAVAEEAGKPPAPALPKTRAEVDKMLDELVSHRATLKA